MSIIQNRDWIKIFYSLEIGVIASWVLGCVMWSFTPTVNVQCFPKKKGVNVQDRWRCSVVAALRRNLATCAPPLWRMTYAKSLLRCFLMSSFQNVEIMYFIEKKVQYLLQRQQKNIIDSPTNIKEKGLEVFHRSSRAMCGSWRSLAN